MELEPTAALLGLIFLAAYIQTVMGFAFGLVVVAGATSLKISPVVFTAALVSITSFFNIVIALKGEWHRIELRNVKLLTLGLVPGVLLGVLLLEYLSRSSVEVLKLFLGFTVLVAASLSFFRFRPFKKQPASWLSVSAGALGGLCGGLFSVSGPPIVYYLHKQALPVRLLKNTMLCVFAVSTFTRILFISTQGHLGEQVLLTSLLAIPLVAVATAVGKRLPLPLGEQGMRRFSFILLALMGGGSDIELNRIASLPP